jgi:hypothetical protein
MVCAGALYGWPTHNVASWRCRSHGPGACAARTADGYSAPREQPEPVARAARAGRTCSPDGREGYPDARLSAALLAARTYTLTRRSPTSRERPRTHAWAKPCLAARTYNAVVLHTFRERSQTLAWAKSPVWPRRATTCTAPHVPRTITSARMGEALFGGPTHGARTNAVSRDEHLAWPPAWDGAS